MLPSKRLTLEYPVADTDDFYGWAKQAALKLGLDLPRRGEYHFTILHIGKPNEIFAAVKSALQEPSLINEDQFLQRLRAWLVTARSELPSGARVIADRLATLGSAPSYSVVSRIASRALPHLHYELLDSFAVVLEDCGVEDGRRFMSMASALGYSGKSWNPHITVGETHTPIDVGADAIEIRLLPPRVRNDSYISASGN